MKTFTTTTLAIVIAVATLTATGKTATPSIMKPVSTWATSADEHPVTSIKVGTGFNGPDASLKGVNKIWVAGNVRIVLKQDDKEGVTAEENFDAEKTSVLTNGQTLYINSMEDHQVTINVALKDLQRIEAAGSAVVVMSNNFDVKYLQLFVSQSAKVKVNAVIGSLYTVINDDATVKMNGSAEEHTLMASNMSNLKFGDFVCTNTKSVPAKAISVALLAR